MLNLVSFLKSCFGISRYVDTATWCNFLDFYIYQLLFFLMCFYLRQQELFSSECHTILKQELGGFLIKIAGFDTFVIEFWTGTTPRWLYKISKNVHGSIFISWVLEREIQKHCTKTVSPFSKLRCLAFAKENFGIENLEFLTAFI